MLPALALAGVNDGYKSVQLTVPYAKTKPVIDGVIDDTEWSGAISLNALQTTGRAVSSRQTRFWLAWDEDNLYLAMRSPLRDGERPIQALRDTDTDVNVVFDDSYELWLDLDTNSTDGQPVYFQYLGNFAGARWDVMNEPAVGNSRLGWTAGWKTFNRLSPTGAWEMEVVIPRASLLRDKPFTDGTEFRAMFCRNYKRPWEQNSITGTGNFSSRETYAHCTLSKTAPAVHLLAVGNLQSFGLQATSSAPVHWTFESDGGVKKEDTFALDLDTPGKGHYRIRVTTLDGKTTLLDWCALRQISNAGVATNAINDRGDQVALNVTFNPVAHYVRATGDFINYDERAKIKDCILTVGTNSQTFTIDDRAYIKATVPTGDLPAGEYTAKLVCRDAAGRPIIEREQKFTKQDHWNFAWWQTGLGDIEKVIEPWTPVTLKGNDINVWGRTMTIGTAGLPAQIQSQGQPLLAGPIRLESATAGKLTTFSNAEHRVVVQADATLDTLNIRSVVTAEFDGMYKIEMTLTPASPTKLDRLRVVVPVRPEVAEYFHATGQGIRYGFDMGYLPKGNGRLWDSRKIDGQNLAVGSFIPYVWLGNTRGGLCWFADSDEGWLPNNDTPALEIRRDNPNSVDLVLNLISAPATLDAPRKITFAFQATPVKPLAPGARMDSWWCGDTFKDYQGVTKKGGHLIWSNIPFTLDPDECTKLVEAQHKAGANAVPYLEWNHIAPQFTPEVGYFGEHWKASGSDGGLCFEDSLTDFLVYQMSKWTTQTGIDGIYIDNVRPVTCANLAAGRGYRLPDGRVQPTFQIFATRRLFLRIRAAFAENGKAGKFVLHMTNHMVIPWLAAADTAYDGEHNVIYPESGLDFMDLWTLDRLRVDYPGQWGVNVNFMHEYQGNWPKDRLAAAMRAYTGTAILHDALATGNHNGGNIAHWKAREKFGLDADDVQFLPYWEKDTGIRCDNDKVRISGWQRPGKLLLAVVNFGEKTTAKITLKTPATKITDAETGEVLPDLNIPVGRHDYRQIVIEAK